MLLSSITLTTIATIQPLTSSRRTSKSHHMRQPERRAQIMAMALGSHTPEHRAKQSEALKASPRAKAQRAELHAARRGATLSKEHCASLKAHWDSLTPEERSNVLVRRRKAKAAALRCTDELVAYPPHEPRRESPTYRRRTRLHLVYMSLTRCAGSA